MNQPSSQFVKKTILKLLRAIGSEKEDKEIHSKILIS